MIRDAVSAVGEERKNVSLPLEEADNVDRFEMRK